VKTACILTLEHLNRDFALSGGALRVAGLRQCLEDLGFKVTILRKKNEIPEAEGEKTFEIHRIRDCGLVEHNIQEKIRECSPNLLLVEQWGLLDEIEDLDILVVGDLHGSLLWENRIKGYSTPDQMRSKVYGLGKCDALLVPGERQYYYFMSWAMMAGLDLGQDRLIQIPLHLPKQWYEQNTHSGVPKQKKLIMGGAEWPWVQLKLRRELEDFFTSHDFKIESFFYDPLATELHPHTQSPKTKKVGMAHREVVKEYSQAAIAFDYYRFNRERELAITTRTVEYLYCGVPVIYSKGLELSQFLEANNFGFVIENLDEILQIQNFQEILSEKQAAIHENFLNTQGYEKTLERFQSFLETASKNHRPASAFSCMEEEKRIYFKSHTERGLEIQDLKQENQRLETEAQILSKEVHNLRNLWARDMREGVENLARLKSRPEKLD
jgi:hypothetical protein